MKIKLKIIITVGVVIIVLATLYLIFLNIDTNEEIVIDDKTNSTEIQLTIGNMEPGDIITLADGRKLILIKRNSHVDAGTSSEVDSEVDLE